MMFTWCVQLVHASRHEAGFTPTLPGRTDNAIKNHWNATLRRQDANAKKQKRSSVNNKQVNNTSARGAAGTGSSSSSSSTCRAPTVLRQYQLSLLNNGNRSVSAMHANKRPSTNASSQPHVPTSSTDPTPTSSPDRHHQYGYEDSNVIKHQEYSQQLLLDNMNAGSEGRSSFDTLYTMNTAAASDLPYRWGSSSPSCWSQLVANGGLSPWPPLPSISNSLQQPATTDCIVDMVKPCNYRIDHHRPLIDNHGATHCFDAARAALNINKPLQGPTPKLRYGDPLINFKTELMQQISCNVSNNTTTIPTAWAGSCTGDINIAESASYTVSDQYSNIMDATLPNARIVSGDELTDTLPASTTASPNKDLSSVSAVAMMEQPAFNIPRSSLLILEDNPVIPYIDNTEFATDTATLRKDMDLIEMVSTQPSAGAAF